MFPAIYFLTLEVRFTAKDPAVNSERGRVFRCGGTKPGG